MMSEKASPFHTAEKLHEKMMASLNRGYLTPEQAGIEIPVEFKGDTPPFDKQLDVQLKAKQMGGPSPKKPGGSNQGRPKNSKDTSKRPTKPAKPVGASEDTVSLLSMIVWAKDVQTRISEYISPAILQHFNKKNLRSLSSEEVVQAERIKFRILSGLEPYSEVTAEKVHEIMQSDLTLSAEQLSIYNNFKNHMIQQNDREPTLDELRLIQASTYAIYRLRGRQRGSVDGFGQSEGDALQDATNKARDMHGSIQIMRYRFNEVAGGFICSLLYEYNIEVSGFV
jgi:hypothetical protein